MSRLLAACCLLILATSCGADTAEGPEPATESESGVTIPGGPIETRSPAEKTEAAAELETEAAYPTRPPVVVTATPEPAGVTLANFNKLQNGMTYEEVVAILGSEGEVLSESTVMDMTTVMYQWQGEAFASNMNVMFQNGEMMSKAQFGLK